MNKLLILLLFGGVLWGSLCIATPVEQYQLKLQPEFDRVDATKYLKNEKLMNLLFKCLMFDEPCDIVGKFIKPRAKGGLLGNCEKCTATQEKLMQDWFGIFKERFPEMYKAAYKKFVDNEGKTLSEEDKVEIQGIFSEEALKEYVAVYRELLNKSPATNDEKDSDDSTKTRSERSVTRNIRTLSSRNKRQFEVPTFPPFTLGIPAEANNETSSSTTTTTTTTPSPPGETTTPAQPQTTPPPTSPPTTLPPPPPFTFPPPPAFPKLSPPPEFKLPKFPSFGK